MKTIRLEVDDLFEDISKPSLSIIGPDYKVIVLYRDPRAIMTSITLRWFSVGICKFKPGYKSHDLLLLECSHWFKLQHSDWRANLVKDFF